MTGSGRLLLFPHPPAIHEHKIELSTLGFGSQIPGGRPFMPPWRSPARAPLSARPQTNSLLAAKSRVSILLRRSAASQGRTGVACGRRRRRCCWQRQSDRTAGPKPAAGRPQHAPPGLCQPCRCGAPTPTGPVASGPVSLWTEVQSSRSGSSTRRSADRRMDWRRERDQGGV